MRIGMISVLSSYLAFICLPHPAAAQFIPGSPQGPQASFRKPPSPANLSQFPSAAESKDVASLTSLRNAPAELPLSLRNWTNQQEGAGAIGVESPAETNQCAHILIYRAPTIDSRMIMEAPKEFSNNMPKLGGLQACSLDFQGVMATPQLGPFLGPRRIRDLDPRLGIQLYPLRPQSSTREGPSGRIPYPVASPPIP